MKKLKKGIPFLIYMLIWSLYILFAWSRTHPGQIVEVSLFILYLVLPASAFIISVLYGQSDHRAIYLLTYIILWYDGAAWLLLKFYSCIIN